VTSVCGKCQKGDWFVGDFVKFSFEAEIFEFPDEGESLGDARHVLTEAFDGYYNFHECAYGAVTETSFIDFKYLGFDDGICRDRGRLTVTGLLCNKDESIGDCRYDKEVVVIKEWSGEDIQVDPKATDDLIVSRTLRVDICKD